MDGAESRLERQRREPMGDEAAEAALLYLVGFAEEAGVAKAQMTYLEHFRKSELARLKRLSHERSDAAREDEARCHPDYLEVLKAQQEAIEKHEKMYWKRLAAEATIEAWRTKHANQRGAERMR